MMSSTVSVPPAIRSEWALLSAGETAPIPYEPTLTTTLPEAVQRWLAHSIRPGTPMWSSVELVMVGQIKLGSSWRPFRARQILAPQRGFIWAAETHIGRLPVRGYDSFCLNCGQMRWRMLGIFPMMTAGGIDVTRSAAGRLACEGVLVPTAFQSAAWSAGPSPDTAIMTRVINEETEEVTLLCDPGGALREVSMRRWGNPEHSSPGSYPFGVAVEAETDFGGTVIPTVLRAGWWWGTPWGEDGDFLHAEITDAVFR